jgi:hypothetical protein
MTSTDAAVRARKAHKTLETMHAVVYFAPEPAEMYAELGIRDGMRGYFASRSAALGKAPLELVISTFYNFSPALVAQAIPEVWETTTPDAILTKRLEAVDATYRRILGEEVLASADMAEAAALAREATTVLRVEGRPLYAAHAALPWPEESHLQLFHAQTLLREHRGDGHIAALVLADLDPLDALITYIAHGQGQLEAVVRATRGWTDEEWEAGLVRARAKGLIDDTNGFTPAGVAQREEIEAQTDRAAAAPYELLGADRTERLRNLVRPWSRTISDITFGGGT